MEKEILCEPPVTKKLKSGRVVLNPGESVGKHTTKNKEEIILVVKGKATVIIEGKEMELDEGKSHFIKDNISHDVRNDTDKPLKYVYVVGLF